jgi:hypothetical protein
MIIFSNAEEGQPQQLNLPFAKEKNFLQKN